MKKISKVLGVILSAVTAISMISGVTANAFICSDPLVDDQGGLISPDAIPENCEDIKDTDIFKNHQAFFGIFGPYVYRSTKYPTIFYYFDKLYFDDLRVDIHLDKEELAKEIYNKYKDRLNYTRGGFSEYKESKNDESFVYKIEFCLYDCIDLKGKWPDGFSSYDCIQHFDYSTPADFSDQEAKIQERYNHIGEDYSVIMEMVAEMKEAGCIKDGAEYTPFKSGYPRSYCTYNMEISEYNCTQDELTDLVHQACDKATVIFSDSGLARVYFVNFDVPNYIGDDPVEEEKWLYDYLANGGNAEGAFAVLDLIVSKEDELGIKHRFYCVSNKDSDEIDVEDATSELKSKTVDCLSILNSLGDVNIDGRVGIQDIIAMNKSVSDIIALNSDQITAADMNFDGKVDGKDLDMILRKVVEL